MLEHWIRVGALGHVGRFSSPAAVRFPRAARVIVRTVRGLEIGEVLTAPESQQFEPADVLPPEYGEQDISGDHHQTPQLDGEIVRGMTVEDELLSARLERHREAAYEACRERVEARGLNAVLMDVEHLFDGQTLVFYFLGEPPAELAVITDELAEAYDAQAQFSAFAAAVTNGCGPDCGTEAAGGCATDGASEAGGCSSCGSGCAVASAVRPKIVAGATTQAPDLVGG